MKVFSKVYCDRVYFVCAERFETGSGFDPPPPAARPYPVERWVPPPPPPPRQLSQEQMYIRRFISKIWRRLVPSHIGALLYFCAYPSCIFIQFTSSLINAASIHIHHPAVTFLYTEMRFWINMQIAECPLYSLCSVMHSWQEQTDFIKCSNLSKIKFSATCMQGEKKINQKFDSRMH